MDKSFIKFNKIIRDINETINLLFEQGTINIPEGSEVKLKFKVVADGAEYENGKPDINDQYIELKYAKEYKPDVEVGDEIEIVCVDGESDNIWEILTSDGVSLQDLEQITLTAPKTYRIGGKIIRFGGRNWNKIKRLISSAIYLKKYFDRYGKKIQHSRCWCLELVSDYVDESTGTIDREQYESDLVDFIEPVQKEYLSKWDYCVNKYGKYIEERDPRQETYEECVTINDIWTEEKSIFDAITQKLQSFFEVKGINIKKKKTDTKSDSSVVEKINQKDEIELKFTAPVKRPDPAGGGGLETLFPASTYKFKILGLSKEKNNTVRLEKVNPPYMGEYVFSFTTNIVRKPQSGSVWKAKTDGTLEPEIGSWSGSIESYS